MASRVSINDCHAFLVQEHIAIFDVPCEYDYAHGYYTVFFADPDGIKVERVHELRLDPPAA